MNQVASLLADQLNVNNVRISAYFHLQKTTIHATVFPVHQLLTMHMAAISNNRKGLNVMMLRKALHLPGSTNISVNRRI